jgi:hypothetical protein
MNFKQFGEVKKLQIMGQTKVFFSSLQMPSITPLSIQKIFFFLGDLKVVSSFVKILL